MTLEVKILFGVSSDKCGTSEASEMLVMLFFMKIYQAVHLSFVHFSTCILYFDKQFQNCV